MIQNFWKYKIINFYLLIGLLADNEGINYDYVLRFSRLRLEMQQGFNQINFGHALKIKLLLELKQKLRDSISQNDFQNFANDGKFFKQPDYEIVILYYTDKKYDDQQSDRLSAHSRQNSIKNWVYHRTIKELLKQIIIIEILENQNKLICEKIKKMIRERIKAIQILNKDNSQMASLRHSGSFSGAFRKFFRSIQEVFQEHSGAFRK